MKGDVKKMVERPMSVKMLETQGMVARTLLKYGKRTVVACSFGKDSLVVLWYAVSLDPNVHVVFNNTGVEYPQTIRFMKELTEAWNLNLIIAPPIRTFWDVTSSMGHALGDKNSNHSAGKHCCYYLKERPMKLVVQANEWKAVLTGVTAMESRQRRITSVTHGMCYTYKDWNVRKVHPILWWTAEEVLWFIKKMGIPNNPLYAEGSSRVGCMTCTAYKTWPAEILRCTPKLFKIIANRIIERGIVTEHWLAP